VTISYLAPEFGALSSTFVYREVAELRARGYTVQTLSTRQPADSVISAEAIPFVEQTEYLDDRSIAARLLDMVAVFANRPVAFSRSLLTVVRDSFVCEAPRAIDRLKLYWHFVQGCTVARRLNAAQSVHLHAHFAHVPTSIAMYGAMLAEVPFSFTAHANDLFERGVALRQKAQRAAFVAVISEFNRRYLIDRGCDEAKLHVVRCGIDTNSYPMRAAKEMSDPPSISLVARLVEKKGVEVLVKALRLLHDRGVAFHMTIVGEGPLEDSIRHDVRAASLDGVVHMMGAQPQELVREVFQNTDVFVLPCLKAASGDMDGIPVVLIEALAMGVPVISTDVSGIPELVESGVSGALVSSGDALALADMLASLLGDPDRLRGYADAGRKVVETEFDLSRNVDRLVGLIEQAAGAHASAALATRAHV
jgi:glycosyltransferase involved in cell wall biosynthesis